MQIIAWNTHGTVNATILRTTVSIFFSASKASRLFVTPLLNLWRCTFLAHTGALQVRLLLLLLLLLFIVSTALNLVSLGPIL